LAKWKKHSTAKVNNLYKKRKRKDTNFNATKKITPVVEFIYKNGYLEDLRPRIEKMLKISEECGWGFPDTLYDFYYQYQ
jgi:hypothetical protein